MPEWNIHNKWAEKLGISIQVSNYVNCLIDSPEKCPGFLDFAADRDNWLDFYKRTHSSWPYKANLKSLRSDSHLFRKLLWIEHDAGRGRSNKTATYIQLKFMRHKGSEYVKAWYLHHALDYVEKLAAAYPIEEILSRLEERTKTCPELEAVKDLIRSNSTQILQDLESNS
ncbi:hypothetical protein DRJ00_03890 [Candidatus Aerophobetes bacterium]|uniref:Uncharacterized protein n=1 Tax=Aerophobetes bacterium TaxID=2030807 RepID=A0A497E419_UNCAE|nr:MAG: hypothetical protein DRJ00_03890 [Candidatus Aerophobetes bacterium]